MDDAQRRAVGDTRWYHVLELGDGVVTPGEFDLRSTEPRVGLPDSLAGARCLDVGTRDGYWAFAMERRGAAEVVGIDVDDTRQHDWPMPAPVLGDEQIRALARSADAFAVAKDCLGSQAQRRVLSVYDLSEDAVGLFDVAFLGTLLIHLRDPIGALTAVGRVLRPGGLLIVNETISLTGSLRRQPNARLMTLDVPFWWQPNRAALKRYVEAAGFAVTRLGRPYLVDRGPAMARPKLSYRNELGTLPRQLILRAGLPHVTVHATPRG